MFSSRHVHKSELGRAFVIRAVVQFTLIIWLAAKATLIVSVTLPLRITAQVSVVDVVFNSNRLRKM
jgi:hypothetical protein